jgi:hypothetical protein
MNDLQKEFEKRDRRRRYLSAKETPQERLAAMARLQEATWAALRASPSGYAHYLRRNYQARSIRVRRDDVPRL